MLRFQARNVVRFWAIILTLGACQATPAQMGVGTWVKQTDSSAHVQLTMTAEACCNAGRRLTYRFGDSPQTMVVESTFDGRDAPVLVGGKPSGQTMAISIVDALHTSTVIKLNGKPFAVSKATISADGKTLSVENDVSSPIGGMPVGKHTEIWRRR